MREAYQPSWTATGIPLFFFCGFLLFNISRTRRRNYSYRHPAACIRHFPHPAGGAPAKWFANTLALSSIQGPCHEAHNG